MLAISLIYIISLIPQHIIIVMVELFRTKARQCLLHMMMLLEMKIERIVVLHGFESCGCKLSGRSINCSLIGHLVNPDRALVEESDILLH